MRRPSLHPPRPRHACAPCKGSPLDGDRPCLPSRSPAQTCDAQTWDASWSKLYPNGAPPPPPPWGKTNSSSYDDDDGPDALGSSLGKACAVWLPITVILGIPLSLLFVHLFKKWPLLMTKASLFGTLGALAVLTVVCLVQVLPLGILMLLFLIVFAITTWLVRNELELCAELLGVASESLL